MVYLGDGFNPDILREECLVFWGLMYFFLDILCPYMINDHVNDPLRGDDWSHVSGCLLTQQEEPFSILPSAYMWSVRQFHSYWKWKIVQVYRLIWSDPAGHRISAVSCSQITTEAEPLVGWQVDRVTTDLYHVVCEGTEQRWYYVNPSLWWYYINPHWGGFMSSIHP